jgi:ABC-type histidine transport system ATPase subunit
LLLLIDGIKLDEGAPTRVHTQPASERVRSFLTWGT